MAVRSSALGEDSAQATFAGQQDTILWVRGVDGICDAVRRLLGEPLQRGGGQLPRSGSAARDGAGDGGDVQLMVDAVVSGVMFTCNPVSGDPSMVAINASWGLGLAVVGGEVTPDDYLISKITREVVRQTVGDKQVQYVPAPDGEGTVCLDVEDERRLAWALDDAARHALVDAGRRIERHFGAPQDIEWAIARGQPAPAGLFILQSRPVTALPQRPPAPPVATSALGLVMSQVRRAAPGARLRARTDGADR